MTTGTRTSRGADDEPKRLLLGLNMKRIIDAVPEP
jgi:hypothetical protein